MNTNGNGTGNGHYCPLDLVENFLRRFIIYPSEHALTAHALWIGHTHFMKLWETTPRLAFMSPLPESGKTRALEVTSLFVPNPKLAFSASAASLVRVIANGHNGHDKEKGDGIPTILYDEIDNVFSKAEEGISELRAALNAGYRRTGMAMRCINRGEGVVEFKAYSALAVAGLKTLPDALATRSIFIHMRRRAPDEAKESYREKYQKAEAKPIMEALTEWAIENEANISDEPDMPAEITDRAADIWEPLFAVADAAGGDWPERARAAAIYLTGAAKDDNVKAGSDIELLIDIKAAFVLADRLHAEELVRRLCNREESPWMDMGKGKPITAAILRERLKPYGIKSKQVKVSGTNGRGYRLEDFHDAWKRYADPVCPGSVTTVTTVTELSNKDKKVTPVTPVTPGTEDEDNPEPGAFEPDFDENVVRLKSCR